MKIEHTKGDITEIEADAIVNAANEALRGGAGVDGAIHRAGGPAILEACKAIEGGCPTGQAVITTAGNLPASKVIHTVGPVWRGGNKGEAELLASCYRESLKLAEANGLKRITFPNISTGVYGFPKRKAAEIAIATVCSHSAGQDMEVLFVCYDEENFRLYGEVLSKR